MKENRFIEIVSSNHDETRLTQNRWMREEEVVNKNYQRWNKTSTREIRKWKKRKIQGSEKISQHDCGDRCSQDCTMAEAPSDPRPVSVITVDGRTAVDNVRSNVDQTQVPFRFLSNVSCAWVKWPKSLRGKINLKVSDYLKNVTFYTYLSCVTWFMEMSKCLEKDIEQFLYE